MMGYADAIHLQVLAELKEMAVAQLACSHLDTDLVKLGVLPRFEMYEMERNLLFVAEIPAEKFIPVRLFST